ncbi:hypothetical protein JTB14_002678 [Gonioctena quinquepunctata]|nr:hypothetical protein JTB14_002678 [Gonioctena quinquepunctata]
MKKLKQSDKEAEKEVSKITSILPAHALVDIVPPGPPADSTPAPSDTEITETSLPPPRSEDGQAITSLPHPKWMTNGRSHPPPNSQSIEEREPLKLQNDSAQSPCDDIQITATPPPPGLHEAEEPARKIQDIEAVLSTSSASSGGDWSVEVETATCNES